jgi:phosphoribosylformylglycinamidine cyclo-ligase
VRRIQAAMASTHGPQVMGKAGAFAGMFRLNGAGRELKKPVLVGCADGVGTKVLLGIKAKKLFGLGIDLVAMNVNDLTTCGATPLFFLDYLAVNKLEPDQLLELIEGVAEGCRQAGCALLGGETAEMPDLYRRGDFDLAGFAVGVVDQNRSIDGRHVSPGDVIIGLPSSGVHSNGYSLVRKVIASRKLSLKKRYDDLGETLADAVLRPTKIYVKDVIDVLASYRSGRVVCGMAHITGGGLNENVARAIPSNCDAVIDRGSWTPPPIFGFLKSHGVRQNEMMKVFNMGIGYVLIVRPRYVKGVVARLDERGADPVVIGEIKRGTGKVILK